MNVYHKHSTVFALENSLKNAKFSVLFTSKTAFSGYFE